MKFCDLSPDTISHRFRLAAAQMRFAPAIEDNLRRIETLATEARRRRADAVLFPECAVTGYRFDFASLEPPMIRAALQRVGEIAATHKIHLLTGCPVFRKKKLYNCLVVFDRSGNLVHCHAKNQLTPDDRSIFTPGNAIALFELDGIPATAIICHERRYPELVRLGVMAGARIVFHPNAGLDRLPVSRKKRGGRDGIAVRAFENAVYYAFANSVGPQGEGLWSAGDSKIVGPDGSVHALADNENESVIATTLDLSLATGKYARESLEHPRFLAQGWRAMVTAAIRQSETENRAFLEDLA